MPTPIDILFPGKGVHRAVSFQGQPPYTTPYAMNVRPIGALSRRRRGGPRPGLISAFAASEERGAYPVNLLSQVPVISNERSVGFEDDFTGFTSGSPLEGSGEWANVETNTVNLVQAYIVDEAMPPPNVALINGLMYATSEAADLWCTGHGRPRCAIHDAPTGIAADDFLSAEFTFQWRKSQIQSMLSKALADKINVQLRCFVGVTTPDAGYEHSDLDGAWWNSNYISEGLCAYIRITCSDWATQTLSLYFRLAEMAAGVVVDDAEATIERSFSSLENMVRFRLNVYPEGDDHTARLYQSDYERVSLATAALDPLKQYGFALCQPRRSRVIGIGCYAAIERFGAKFHYVGAEASGREAVCASIGGVLYTDRDSADTALAAATGDLTVAANTRIMAESRYDKLYIADYGLRVSGSGGAIDAGGKLTDAAVTDWRTYDINVDDDVVMLYDATTLAFVAACVIATIAEGYLELTSAPGAANYMYRVQRTPKYYDASDDTLYTWTATAGTVPIGCTIIARFQDRMFLAGDLHTPHAWYASRRGDQLDWDYGAHASDPSRAVAGTNARCGEIGLPIVALLASADDYLLFGCRSSLWMLVGDPAGGGQIRNVSRTVGVLDRFACCNGLAGECFILDSTGLYRLQRGGGLEPLSEETLPADLRDIDPTLYEVLLDMEPRDYSLHIYVRPRFGGGGVHYIYDLLGGGFWPMRFALDEHSPFSTLIRADSAGVRSLWLGCYDGALRRFSAGVVDDDGTAYDSDIVIGPFRIGGGVDAEGIVTELLSVMGETSGTVTLSLFGAASAEQAVSRAMTEAETPDWTAEAGAGRNYRQHPRVRGYAACLRLHSSSSRWEVEQLAMIVEAAGRIKLL